MNINCYQSSAIIQYYYFGQLWFQLTTRSIILAFSCKIKFEHYNYKEKLMLFFAIGNKLIMNNYSYSNYNDFIRGISQVNQ